MNFRSAHDSCHSFFCCSFPLFSILLSLLSVIVLSGCEKKDAAYKENRMLMDTFCSITVIASSSKQAKEAIGAGFAEIKKLEKLLNYFDPDSELSAINRQAGIAPVKVSQETMEIIQKAITIASSTDGAFNPSIAPIMKLWKFSKNTSDVFPPSVEAMAKARRHIDYRKIQIARATSEVFLREQGMELDLGGIAKGYASDKAIGVLMRKGIKSALVAIAGDIRGYGMNLSGNPWTVGIQNPRPRSGSDKPWEDVFATLPIENRAISTSGDYQRFFIRNGKRFHHIIDPYTGLPSWSGLISSTVLAPEGYLADSISTAVFVMGKEAGMKFIESMNLDAVLVDTDMRVHVTRNLRNRIELVQKEFQELKM